MQIVIKIPEEYYKAITEIPNHQCTADMLIIKNGTLLSKGHGRLIDADELSKRLVNASMFYRGETADMFDTRFADGLREADIKLAEAQTVVEAY